MTAPPARVLGLHALSGPVDPWLPDGLSVRVLMHPRLGIPLGPLAVSVMELGEEPDTNPVGFTGSGPGWRGGGEVDGVAWLRLAVPSFEPPPVFVRLEGGFEPETRISVVRRTGDLGVGIAAVHATLDAPVLSAPDVRHLRIEGHGRVERASIAQPAERFVGEVASPLGLPLGRIDPDPSLPSYLGDDEGGVKAFDRVRAGAPLRHAPHEPPTPDEELADPDLARDAELARVKQLVLDPGNDAALADRLETLARTPHAERLDAAPVRDLVRPSPQPTQGSLATFEAVLAAAGEPGIARWMGLATRLEPPSSGSRLVAISVAGRWVLRDRPWARWLSSFDDPNTVVALLDGAGVGEQLGPRFPGLVSVHLWAQARILLEAPPDPPDPPLLSGEPAGAWTNRDGADVVRLPLGLRSVGPLAQAGIVRLDRGEPAPVQPVIPGTADRIRPLLVADGTGLDLVIPDPPDDGAYRFRAWQADMFGRWSDATRDVAVSGPPRPGLPRPELRWFRDPDERQPTGDEPFEPRIRVRVAVPVRSPGQPEIVAVTVALDGAERTVEPAVPAVEVALAGDLLAPAASSSQRLVATFAGSDGSSVASDPIAVQFVDRRPPLPPPRPAVLQFTDPPDAAGAAGYRVALPSAPGIEGWRIFVTTESRLRQAAAADGLTVPPAGAGRNARADAWLAQAARMRRERFDCLTPAPVAGPEPFRGSLPGTLAEVVFVRPVPQRKGAEPDFASCPVVAIAVPFAVAPAAPELSVDRAAQPPVLRIRAQPGVVAASRYRLRLRAGLADDVRSAVPLSEGELVDGEAAVPVPRLRPFATAVAIAEVQARPEDGVDPRPRPWSAPSAPMTLVELPPDPPVLAAVPVATASAGELRVTVPVPGLAARPTGGPFVVRLFRRADASAAWEPLAEAPVAAGSAVVTAPVQPGAAHRVVLVDPLGRASAPVDVP